MSKTTNLLHASKIQQFQSLASTLPWNFQTHLMRKEVKSLESPVNTPKYLPLQNYVGLFKDYAESLQQNDFNTLSSIVEPSFSKKLGASMEQCHRESARYGFQFKIENQKGDGTDFFLYDIKNYFLVNMDTNRSKMGSIDKYNVQQEEPFKFQYPHLEKNNEVTLIEKDVKCTQIAYTEGLNEGSRGLLMMRLYFVVNTFLNLYIWDPQTQQAIVGHPITQKNVSNKKSHLLVIDKLVAEMHIGDTFLDPQDQLQDRIIKQYTKDEGIMISDFDNYMKGNPFIVEEGAQDVESQQ